MNTKNTLFLLKVTLLIVVSICLEVYNNNNNHPSLNLSVYFFLFLLSYIFFLCRELTCGERNNFKSNNHQVHRKEFESERVKVRVAYTIILEWARGQSPRKMKPSFKSIFSKIGRGGVGRQRHRPTQPPHSYSRDLRHPKIPSSKLVEKALYSYLGSHCLQN